MKCPVCGFDDSWLLDGSCGICGWSFTYHRKSSSASDSMGQNHFDSIYRLREEMASLSVDIDMMYAIVSAMPSVCAPVGSVVVELPSCISSEDPAICIAGDWCAWLVTGHRLFIYGESLQRLIALWVTYYCKYREYLVCMKAVGYTIPPPDEYIARVDSQLVKIQTLMNTCES